MSALFSTPAMRESENDVAFTVDDLIEFHFLLQDDAKLLAALSSD